MEKTGLAHTALLDLDPGEEYEIEVVYDDPEGVSGQATQYLTAYVGKVCIPAALRSYSS